MTEQMELFSIEYIQKFNYTFRYEVEYFFDNVNKDAVDIGDFFVWKASLPDDVSNR